GTGTACSPPDRKLACRPLRVTRRGSAISLTTPSVFSARRNCRNELPAPMIDRDRLGGVVPLNVGLRTPVFPGVGTASEAVNKLALSRVPPVVFVNRKGP